MDSVDDSGHSDWDRLEKQVDRLLMRRANKRKCVSNHRRPATLKINGRIDRDKNRQHSRSIKKDRDWKVDTIGDVTRMRTRSYTRCTLITIPHRRAFDVGAFLPTFGLQRRHSVICRYFPGCRRLSNCPFLHPNAKDINGPAFRNYSTTKGLLIGNRIRCVYFPRCRWGSRCLFFALE